MLVELKIHTGGRSLIDFTQEVLDWVGECGISEGLVTLYLQHTSASLLIQENADPSVQRDLENWLTRLVPENDALYTHTTEGPDDMPAHIKSTLTTTSLCIPLQEGAMVLGTWQGIYLWEHRHERDGREVVVSVVGSR